MTRRTGINGFIPSLPAIIFLHKLLYLLQIVKYFKIYVAMQQKDTIL